MVYAPILPVIHAPRCPCAKDAPESGGGGRADGDRATVTELSRTIYFFSNYSSSQWTLFTRVAKFLKCVLVSVPLWNQDNLNP